MNELAITPAEILLPKTDDMSAFAVIACDQFTSESAYWDKLAETVRGKRTALDLVLPEIYLEDGLDDRITKINENIKSYIKDGVFTALPKGFILTVRTTPFVEKRIGLIGAVDLEKYEYKQKCDALVRATEGTIEERIPPRLKIRKNAEIELPHVMILFDDEKREIVEKLYEERHTLKKLYDFELNMGGGHLEGYFVEDYNAVLGKFKTLLEKERLIAKYGREDRFLFAVGDGNHSLATAKTHWNNLKKELSEKEVENHPARYALAEFVNVYDEGIYFEPIYRYVKNVNRKDFIDGLNKISAGNFYIFDGTAVVKKGGDTDLPTAISGVDSFVKEYITKNGGQVDYVHGENNIKNLVKNNGNAVGILFDKLEKSDLFKYVSKNGAFPRKTFSMGEGVEKRYYLEGRRIKKC
ncbi:MAG: DUF1015 domain-containing protein [Clostridia bacterium]|nr:DUF1015 domain-containing protein [Clostridia bacterium]